MVQVKAIGRNGLRGLDQKSRDNLMKLRNKTIAACVAIAAVVAVIILSIFLLFAPPSRPEVNMREKLNEELSNGYSIREQDWLVWSKIARDSGMILTRMDSWEQFKESYRQMPYTLVIMLDQKSRVVWFKAYVNQAVYYQY